MRHGKFCWIRVLFCQADQISRQGRRPRDRLAHQAGIPCELVGRRSDSATCRACPKGPSLEQRTPRHVSTQSRGPRSGIRREQASAPARAHRADGSAAAFPPDRARSRNDRPPRDEQIGLRCARRRVPKTRSRDRPGLPASNDELESPAASRLCPGILVRAPWRYAHATPGVDCAEECHRPFPAPGRA